MSLLAELDGLVERSRPPRPRPEVRLRVTPAPAGGPSVPSARPSSRRRPDDARRDRSWLGTPATVLLVEDQEDVRAPSAMALERAGYRVVQAESWGHALALTKERPGTIDVIVTDLVMPDQAGVSVFSRLRKEQGPVPVVVVSAYPRVMRLLSGVLEGVVQWLQKPVDVALVVEAVDRALDRVQR